VAQASVLAHQRQHCVLQEGHAARELVGAVHTERSAAQDS